MSADQTPAADPTPGSSRVDVAGLRAAAEAATPGPWCHDGLDGWVATWDDGTPVVEGIEMWAETDAAFIAAADPTTVLALLDRLANYEQAIDRARMERAQAEDAETAMEAERDDLAARLAAAEAAVERLGRWKAEALPVMRGLQYLGRALGVPIGESITARASVDRALDLRNRAEVAERQVQAVLELADSWFAEAARYRSYVAGSSNPDMHRAIAKTLRQNAGALAALAPLDPDAPTGHDGHGDQDTHQVDTDTDATPEATTQPDESREVPDIREFYGLTSPCKADRDGDCDWALCPQVRDNEPQSTGRHCPLDAPPAADTDEAGERA